MSGAALDAAAVTAIVAHMNADHAADSLAIVGRHPSSPARGADVVAATVETLDHTAITFVAITVAGSTQRVVVAWSAPVTERADVRRELVRLTEEARAAGP